MNGAVGSAAPTGGGPAGAASVGAPTVAVAPAAARASPGAACRPPAPLPCSAMLVVSSSSRATSAVGRGVQHVAVRAGPVPDGGAFPSIVTPLAAVVAHGPTLRGTARARIGLCPPAGWHPRDVADVVVVRADADDRDDARDVRLRALDESPDAFASSLEREKAFDDAEWLRRVTTNAWFLAPRGRHDRRPRLRHPRARRRRRAPPRRDVGRAGVPRAGASPTCSSRP